MTGIAKFVLAVGRLLFAGSDAARPKDGRLSLRLIDRGAEVFGRRLLTAALANFVWHPLGDFLMTVLG